MLFALILLVQASATMAQFADTVFVTGANKGQGLEWVKQLALLENPPKVIFATCRDPGNEAYVSNLNGIAKQSTKTKIHILRLDVTNVTEIEQAAAFVEKELGEEGLNVLINNAGIYLRETSDIYDTNQVDTMLTFNVNSVGPVLVVKHLLPMLIKAGNKSGDGNTQSVSRAAIINISSRMGSLALAAQTSPVYHYSMSKAALNMATVKMGNQFKPMNIMAVSFHPGHVSTDMTRGKGKITTLESITSMIETLQSFNITHTARFFDRNGESMDL